MIISSFICFVAKEVDIFIVFQKFQTVSFVPTNRKNIKTDLPSNWILYSQIWKLFPQSLNKGFSDLMLMIILLKIISLSLRTVSSNWRNVDQSRSVLYKSSPFNRYIDIGKVVKTEVDEFLKLIFSNVVFDALRVNYFTDFSRRSLPLIATSPFSLKK